MMHYQIILLGLFIFSILSSCDENPKSNAENSMSAEEKEAFIKKGKGIALETFNTLSSELGKAIQEGGVAKAVKTCNIAAYPLVDSLSKVHNTTIRRTSLKIRNPKNKPSHEESKVLNSYEKAFQSREKLKPKVVEVNGMVSFYAPIIAKPLCLNCHGKVGETLKKEDNVLIKTLYPQDQAIGYEAGNLRGIWSIQFEK
jgi:Protein of unknown function (DUF3365)